eukprot:TRINITY_DN1507_c1_g1_i1.p1 TRINITY_DN1507_c1_g1~~TRINITY_DN1507_c1_g1_i1.p1  ORF type:complete len:412 (-),score=70.73 TRINITY_DN1507_c1_g1_i1:393-1511(-)
MVKDAPCEHYGLQVVNTFFHAMDEEHVEKRTRRSKSWSPECRVQSSMKAASLEDKGFLDGDDRSQNIQLDEDTGEEAYADDLSDAGSIGSISTEFEFPRMESTSFVDSEKLGNHSHMTWTSPMNASRGQAEKLEAPTSFYSSSFSTQPWNPSSMFPLSLMHPISPMISWGNCTPTNYGTDVSQEPRCNMEASPWARQLTPFGFAPAATGVKHQRYIRSLQPNRQGSKSSSKSSHLHTGAAETGSARTQTTQVGIGNTKLTYLRLRQLTKILIAGKGEQLREIPEIMGILGNLNEIEANTTGKGENNLAQDSKLVERRTRDRPSKTLRDDSKKLVGIIDASDMHDDAKATIFKHLAQSSSYMQGLLADRLVAK